MGKSKTPSLPDVPKYYEDPRFTQGLQDLMGYGKRLSSFDFTGNLAPLADTISVNPATTQMFLTGLNAQLAPQFRDMRKNTINELAANNQLESSVLGNRLAEQDTDLQRMLLTGATQFGLSDTERALNNRIKLFGMGLDTTAGTLGYSSAAGNNRNSFNLANYENQVARSMYGQKPSSGGIFGGLSGAVGGGLGGFSMGGPIGAIIGGIGGGLGGYFGGSEVGSGIANLGTSLYAGKYRPGATASNNPFGTGLSMKDFPWQLYN